MFDCVRGIGTMFDCMFSAGLFSWLGGSSLQDSARRVFGALVGFGKGISGRGGVGGRSGSTSRGDWGKGAVYCWRSHESGSRGAEGNRFGLRGEPIRPRSFVIQAGYTIHSLLDSANKIQAIQPQEQIFERKSPRLPSTFSVRSIGRLETIRGIEAYPHCIPIKGL